LPSSSVQLLACAKAPPTLHQNRARDLRAAAAPGGIQRYQEAFPEGFFRGSLFVFDERVSVRSSGPGAPRAAASGRFTALQPPTGTAIQSVQHSVGSACVAVVVGTTACFPCQGRAVVPICSHVMSRSLQSRAGRWRAQATRLIRPLMSCWAGACAAMRRATTTRSAAAARCAGCWCSCAARARVWRCAGAVPWPCARAPRRSPWHAPLLAALKIVTALAALMHSLLLYPGTSNACRHADMGMRAGQLSRCPRRQRHQPVVGQKTDFGAHLHMCRPRGPQTARTERPAAPSASSAVRAAPTVPQPPPLLGRTLSPAGAPSRWRARARRLPRRAGCASCACTASGRTAVSCAAAGRA